MTTSTKRSVLVVAATEAEVDPLGPILRRNVHVLITGVGMVATAVRCASELARGRFDFAMNLGICGSFDSTIALGTVVHVVRDRIAELGVEDGDAFLTMTEVGLFADSTFVNTSPPDIAALRELRPVHGITVNTVHGRESSIAAAVDRFHPQVESMEGAAFMFACIDAGVPFAQVRAVSNIVERRNRSAWRMSEAIAALSDAAVRILDQA